MIFAANKDKKIDVLSECLCKEIQKAQNKIICSLFMEIMA